MQFLIVLVGVEFIHRLCEMQDADVAVRYKPVLFLADNRIACCRKPPAPHRADEGTAPATAAEEPATAPEAVAVG